MIDALVAVLREPWPWYVGGPIIGLVVPALLVFVGHAFGVSSSFRDICAAAIPGRLEFFAYDWRDSGWRLAFAIGLVAGGLVGWVLLGPVDPSVPAVAVSEATRADLADLGITDQTGLAPPALFTWEAFASIPGMIVLILGGWLVGFGTRWAGGCTSGHAISGLSNLQLASLIAVIGFFAGGLVSAHWLLPFILGASG